MGVSEINIDNILMQQIREGSDSAFRQLFDKYFTPLTVYADRILQDSDTAVDVVQALFVSVYENRADMHVDSVRSFLYQSVHNRCLNEIKHRKVHSNFASQATNGADLSSNAVDEIIEMSELEARMVEAIKQLPPQCRRVFEMSRMEGIPNGDIAEQLGISKRTVETQISKALKALRDSLGDMFVVIAILYGWL